MLANKSQTDNIAKNDSVKNKLYVSNLEWNVHENLLKHFLSKFGSVKRCKILRYQDTNRSKGIAFVDFNDALSVQNVLNAKENDLFLNGRSMNVKKYEIKRENKIPTKIIEKKVEESNSVFSPSNIEQPSNCYINKIPYNILINIFSYLSIRDLCIAEQGRLKKSHFKLNAFKIKCAEDGMK